MSRRDLTDREWPRGVPRGATCRRTVDIARRCTTAGLKRVQDTHFQCLERQVAGDASSRRQLDHARRHAGGGQAPAIGRSRGGTGSKFARNFFGTGFRESMN